MSEVVGSDQTSGQAMQTCSASADGRAGSPKPHHGTPPHPRVLLSSATYRSGAFTRESCCPFGTGDIPSILGDQPAQHPAATVELTTQRACKLAAEGEKRRHLFQPGFTNVQLILNHLQLCSMAHGNPVPSIPSQLPCQLEGFHMAPGARRNQYCTDCNRSLIAIGRWPSSACGPAVSPLDPSYEEKVCRA